MKKVIIVHGWAGSPEEPLHKWLKKNLEEKGFEVNVLFMPEPETPKIKEWVDAIKENVPESNEDIYFIGHSIGCQAVLRYLQTIGNVKVGGVVLIAPWIHLDQQTIEEEGEESVEVARPWMETPIEWNKIKEVCDRFVCIFSDDDPYVPLSDEQIFKENLGAQTSVEHHKGHFSKGDEIPNNFPSFETVLKAFE